MSAPEVRAQYSELAQVAQRFGRESNQTQQLISRLQQRLQALEAGGWVGKGAQAFFSEMRGKVLPSVRRLNRALDEARTVSLAISQILKTAEEEAAAPFQGGAGQAATTEAASGEGVTSGTADTTVAGNIDTTPLRDPHSVFQEGYMKELIGKHFAGEDSPETNQLMEKLLQNPQGTDLQRTLDRLADIRGLPREEFRAQYDKFLALRQESAAINGAMESIDLKKHGDFLGSTAAMRYGKVVGDVFGIDPVFGSLLNPTGGMVGPGNFAYNPSDNDPVGYHGIVHDAAGYLRNYHDIGPGYDYLGHELTRKTTDPLTGQRGGIQWWLKQRQLDAPGPDFLLENPVVPGLSGTVYEVVVLDGGGAVAKAYTGVGKLFDGDVAGFGQNMGESAIRIIRIPADINSGLARTGIDTLNETSEVVVGGFKQVGRWLGL